MLEDEVRIAHERDDPVGHLVDVLGAAPLLGRGVVGVVLERRHGEERSHDRERQEGHAADRGPADGRRFEALLEEIVAHPEEHERLVEDVLLHEEVREHAAIATERARVLHFCRRVRSVQ